MTTTDPASAARTLDTLGKKCPVPVIELAKTMPRVDVGDTLVVLSDDPGAKVDIPVWCRMKKHELVGADEDAGVFSFVVRRRH
ncbi:MAG TPA: sulfurtransferase TusA family protein [Egibacteraceae bacterium]|nr:sulfurtransferase TusA family protein [Egibacteraceae bacterium]